MQLSLPKTHFPTLGFALIVATLTAVIAVYSFTYYWRMRQRLEQSLVREGLTLISAFEASVRAGLSGPSVWKTHKLHELIRDTRERADLDFFAFVDPSLTVYFADQRGEYSYSRGALTGLYGRLANQPYDWGYVTQPGAGRCLVVIKPLLLDNSNRIGKRTFRFYQVFLRRNGQPRALDIMTPGIHSVAAMPLAIVGLPTSDVVAITRQAIMHVLSLGLILFFLSSSLVYISISMQQHRSTALALAQARADNQRLLQGLRRSDRLAALGRMAATMAHELRNPLSSIRGFTQLFRKHAALAKDATLCQYADLVISEVDRLNSVITSMLEFSRPVEAHTQASDIRPVIENACRLVRADATHRNIALVTHIPPDVPRIPLDRNLMTQALLNLLINAIDAMPNGGSMYVDVLVASPDTLRLTVRDTGKGIPKELLAQIFEPFFTTKPKGTGLGLATVDNIIAEHNATIHVESELHKGTAFHIELPLSHHEVV
ncbi:MAG: ATP-binding protein [bacterium]|nr:ATP-binding protein [bacterium]